MKEMDYKDLHKKELDEYAKTLGIELDRRLTREDMILEFELKAKEQGVDITMAKKKYNKVEEVQPEPSLKVEEATEEQEAEAEKEAEEAPAEPVEEVKEEEPKAEADGDKIAITDINPTYRKGDVVPKAIYEKWKGMGFKVELMCE